MYAAAYLERYGDHIKALVLDAVVDHSVDLPTNVARNTLSVNDALERFAQWCDQDSTCEPVRRAVPVGAIKRLDQGQEPR